MSYVIARVIKVKSTAIGAMQYHNDRAPGEHLNPDIDPERTHLNYELHDAEGCYLPRKYAAEVDAKIAANRASGRKVRKDAVKLVEGIITASPEFFEGKSEEECRRFFEDAYEFVCAEMGAENVIHFTVHMDETTPHAHWGAVPIKDGRLSWKAFFDGRGGLSAHPTDPPPRITIFLPGYFLPARTSSAVIVCLNTLNGGISFGTAPVEQTTS